MKRIEEKALEEKKALLKKMEEDAEAKRRLCEESMTTAEVKEGELKKKAYEAEVNAIKEHNAGLQAEYKEKIMNIRSLAMER